MSSSLNSFFEHLRWLRLATLSARAELILAGDSLRALIRSGQRHWALEPQFLAVDERGSIQYGPVPFEHGDGFTGWLPRRGPDQPFALDNAAFKERMKAAGLPVPAATRDAAAPRGPVVVRRTGATLGPRFKGPFRDARECPLDEDGRDFYEDHVPGDALTAWFWNGRLACIEREPAPAVTGDGRSTVGELMRRHPSVRVRAAAAEGSPERDAFLRFHGVETSTVLASGRVQPVDFAHARRPVEASDARLLDPAAEPRPAWIPQLAAAGEAVLGAMPEDARAGSLFAVHAVVDASDRLWLLGTDANPAVHPVLYPLIVNTLVAAAEGATQPSAPPAPAA